eukprot:Opistho-1_new@5982
MRSPVCVLLAAVLLGTAGAAVVPSEWQKRIDHSQMLYSDTEPDAQLMPMIGNGYIGHVIGSPNIFSTGLYVGLRHFWQYFINSARTHPLHVVRRGGRCRGLARTRR